MKLRTVLTITLAAAVSTALASGCSGSDSEGKEETSEGELVRETSTPTKKDAEAPKSTDQEKEEAAKKAGSSPDPYIPNPDPWAPGDGYR
jgi:hypothetical protein